jgi:drug/metabolite transporter (DMT)-like permease
MAMGVWCGLLAGALWGMVFLVPALLPAFSPLELALGRYLAYGGFAFLILLPRLRSLAHRLDRADAFALLRHALAGNLVYYMFLALGVRLAGVAPTSLIVGVLPITVTLLGRHDHGSVPLRRLALPLAIVAAGIACINTDLFLHAADTGRPAWQLAAGVLCATGALLCWTWYAVDNARFLKAHAHFTSAEWSALYGLTTGLVSVLAAGIALAAWHGDIAPGRDWRWFWTCNVLLALGASVIGNGLWNVATRRVPVTLSGQLILFETLFALLYGFLYRGTWPRPLEVASIALLVLGVAWSVRVHAAGEELTPP